MPDNDPFALIREAHTSAGNYDLDTDGIIDRMRTWQSLCSLKVIEAGHDTMTVAFETLPTDLDAFVKELCGFCPDLVDQGAGCLPDVIREFEQTGQPIPAKMKSLIEGVNFEDENFPLEIMKRTLQRDKKIKLWWD